MQKIEHIGIAVKDIVAASETYTKLMGYKAYKTETVETEGVITAFFKCGESKIELLQATKPESAIAKFIEKKGEGIHHIAYAVNDILSESARLEQQGFTALQDNPRKGADNKWVAFFHPKTTHGVLVELCQERIDAEN